jgi:cyclic pyranopterin phosphate synthase
VVAPIYKVRLTGGEPLLWPALPELVRALRALLPAAEIGLTTNGTRLAQLAAPLYEAGLTSLNVSIDSVDPERYAAVTRGGQLAAALEGLAAARRVGFARPKINAVLLRTCNGSAVADLVRLAAETGCEVRFIELMPFGVGAAIFATEHLAADAALAALRTAFTYVRPLGRTGTADRHVFRVGHEDVVVGFITPVSRPFCVGCDRVRLDSGGRFLTCLRGRTPVALAPLLAREGDRAVVARLESALLDKRAERTVWPTRAMVATGG